MIYVIYMAAGNSRRFGSNKLLYLLEGKPLYRHTLDLLLKLREEALTPAQSEKGKEEEARTVPPENRRRSPELLRQAKKTEHFSDSVPPFEIIVVTQYEQIMDELKGLPIRSVFCRDSRLGVSYTMKAGIAAAAEIAGSEQGFKQDDWLMFVVADQPYLRGESIKALMASVTNDCKNPEKSCGRAKDPEKWPTSDRERENSREKTFCPDSQKEQESERWANGFSGRQNDMPVPEAVSLRCGARVGNPCLFHSSLIAELMELEGDCGGRRVLKRHYCSYVEITDERELDDIDVRCI